MNPGLQGEFEASPEDFPRHCHLKLKIKRAFRRRCRERDWEGGSVAEPLAGVLVWMRMAHTGSYV